MWDTLSAPLLKHLRFHAPDLAGFGIAPALPVPPTIDDHLACVIETCEQRAIQPRVVIAHSMGGMLALKLALARPDLVPVLVLIAPVVTGRFGLQGIGRQLLQVRGADMLLRASESLWGLIRHDALIRTLAEWWHPDSHRSQQIREDFMRVHPATGIEALISMSQQNLCDDLAQIHAPTLVIVGKQDVTVPPEEGALAAAQIPNARLVTLEGCRHHPHDERPQAFHPILREFLLKQRVL
jgi:pimeloyl-ACP methyl ester carboxylesterase